mmetsp:Transcript_18404/g.56478  ORF Transcript_18404/g.56478 Transcript_18404/m.56478 type:complete len:265 (+) Transcript_18404:638-1432(+)
MLVAEHLARAAKARHDLVENQEHVVFVADLADSLQVRVGRDQDPAARHVRLQDERRHRFRALERNRLVESSQHVVHVHVVAAAVRIRRRHFHEPRRFRSEADLAFGLTGRGHRSGSVAVIRAVSRHDFVLQSIPVRSVVLPRHLEGGLVGFRTARREVRVRAALQVQQLANLRRQLDLRRTRQRRRVVRQLAHRLVRHCGQFLAAVAHVHAPQPGDRVDDFRPVGPRQRAPRRRHHRHRRFFFCQSPLPLLGHRVPQIRRLLRS